MPSRSYLFELHTELERVRSPFHSGRRKAGIPRMPCAPPGTSKNSGKSRFLMTAVFSCPKVGLRSSSFVSQLTPLAKTAIFANKNVLFANKRKNPVKNPANKKGGRLKFYAVIV